MFETQEKQNIINALYSFANKLESNADSISPEQLTEILTIKQDFEEVIKMFFGLHDEAWSEIQALQNEVDKQEKLIETMRKKIDNKFDIEKDSGKDSIMKILGGGFNF